MLQLATTRWLSRHQCVIRILENYTALENYFRVAVVDDKLKGAEHILTELTNIYNKANLYFLKYNLNIFNSFNAVFQFRDCQIHRLSIRCNVILKQLCQNFMNPEIVMEKDLHTINVKHPSYFLSIENLYLGNECNELLKNLPPEGVPDFRMKCLSFYTAAAAEMQKRLPLQNELFKQMAFIAPNIALTANGRPECNDISKVIEHFSNHIDSEKIELEWRNLCVTFTVNEIKNLMNVPIDEMWNDISKTKDFDGNFAFKNISTLAKLILTLPHSNAEAERIFSMVTDIKSKKRNKIGAEILNSLCVFRSEKAKTLHV